MFAIFGLGNPGKEYVHTRHNVGFLVADELAKRLQTVFRNRSAWQAEFAEGEIDGERLLVVKPQTFMNLSGETVRAAMQKEKIPPQNILVVFDDADIPFGEIRFRPSGSAGGHNGMKSIQSVFPVDTNIARVRVGIGRPENSNIPLENFVLQTWSAEEKGKMNEVITKAADEVLLRLSKKSNV